MTLDDIIARAIPIDPNECRIKKAKKEAIRLQTKRDILKLIAENFTPKLTDKSDGMGKIQK